MIRIKKVFICFLLAMFILGASACGNTNKITFSTGDGYTIVGERRIAKGENYSFSVEIEEGYSATDMQVTVNGKTVYEKDGVYIIQDVSSNLKIKVSDVKKLFTVDFDSDGGSAINSVQIPAGKNMTIPTAPKKYGYVFQYWMHNGLEYDFQNPVVEDMTLSAKWKELERYTVSFKIDGVEVDLQEIYAGESVEEPQTIPSKKDYAFINWENDGKRYDFKTAVSGDLVLEANFIYDPVNLINFDVVSGVEDFYTVTEKQYRYGEQAYSYFFKVDSWRAKIRIKRSVNTPQNFEKVEFYLLCYGEGADAKIYTNPKLSSMSISETDLNMDGHIWYKLSMTKQDFDMFVQNGYELLFERIHKPTGSGNLRWLCLSQPIFL